ncbi:hypothetical protein CROQUDRAFT_653884 [Cronartium quercuum f. sp. fusiforme G11]|uniref:Uncharacterized protein n=1 Tax=Cronartium quercuum f. sp. fusiforme G11 TaxID=708437 RepID=A0A9P6NPI6_9BASI|nr:hypothetical protein CROQUDRAFT_653884 [Cronartium quercuum f. sp. fusiforme G11]
MPPTSRDIMLLLNFVINLMHDYPELAARLTLEDFVGFVVQATKVVFNTSVLAWTLPESQGSHHTPLQGQAVWKQVDRSQDSYSTLDVHIVVAFESGSKIPRSIPTKIAHPKTYSQHQYHAEKEYAGHGRNGKIFGQTYLARY